MKVGPKGLNAHVFVLAILVTVFLRNSLTLKKKSEESHKSQNRRPF